MDTSSTASATPAPASDAPGAAAVAPAGITSSQTIGPFFHYGLAWASDLSAAAAPVGPAITVRGRVIDGEGQAIGDAMVESFTPATASAEQALPLAGFRRVFTDQQGGFVLRLSTPPGGPHGQPAAYVTVFARGLLKHQFCAVFLADDPALQSSGLLAQIDPARRATLIAQPASAGDYQWDIRLQGEGETVFFDYR